MVLDLRLLGRFAVAVDGQDVDESRWVRRQAALVVKLLALAPHQRLHQEQIMEVLWPGADRETAANGLHKMVHLARHALEPRLSAGNDSRFLQRGEGLLRLVSATGLRIDADEFERLALRALRDGDEAVCQDALRLYEGDLLPADRFAEWASERRDRLRTLRLQVLAALAERLAARGELAEAIRSLQQLLAVEPTNEQAHRSLMECFARAGARAQA
ncbi:MAG TPA: BTAD domain-containing putative transcriptional regulator, partial [Planctomycetota bacterium]|nr:BTAD domain-containing putative transcriptional regulator [Planctomycetota bacterium]